MFTDWSDELVAALHEPTPSSAISTKKVAGATISFTSDKYVQNRLDELVGTHGWETDYTVVHFPRPFEQRGKTFVGTIVCRLKILGVMKSSGADLVFEEKMYGSPTTNGQAQAFKRAAMLFGVARELWDKEDKTADDDGESQGAYPSKVTSIRKPAAKKSGGISQKQADLLESFGVPAATIGNLTTDDLGSNGKDLIGAIIEYKKDNRIGRDKKLSTRQLRAVFKDLDIKFVEDASDEDDGYDEDED